MNEWVTFVCRFEPNRLLSMQIFHSNTLLARAERWVNIPEKFFANSEAPFTIGTPEQLGFSIARIQVWN